MKMPKATDEDKDRFREYVATVAGAEVKPMFGQLGAFVNGNMFAGLFGSGIGLKLAADDLAELAEAGGTPFGPEERPMGGFLSLPASYSSEQSAPWVEKAAAYVGTLPPKTRAPKAKKK